MDQMPNARTSKPRVAIESITFSDGTKIDLGHSDIVAIVGPNNAGKSAALRELKDFVTSNEGQKVIKSASIVRVGAIGEVHSFLRANCKVIGDEYHGGGIAIKN